jgi:hypothetical protein
MSFDISWLIGRAVTEVVHTEPASWRFRFDDDSEIRPACPWRLIRSGSIALTSEDHGHVFGLGVPVDAAARCQALLGELKVRRAEVRDDTRDIVLDFDDGTRLEIVPLSSGYESWDIIEPSGRRTFAQGGGNLVTWPAS